MGLTEKTCIPCQGGIPPLSGQEAQDLLAQTPGWALIDNASKIQRRFTFNNFVDAMQFATNVGELAEQENHHPDITFGWGYCLVLFYTHKIKGLHENDFIMAAKANSLTNQ